eukprot:234985_1
MSVLLLLLLQFITSVQSEQDVCVWGRKQFPNMIINGKYKYHRNYRSYPWYVKDIDLGPHVKDSRARQFNKLHLWHIPSNKEHFWVITLIPPPNEKFDTLIAQCAFENATMKSTNPMLCFHTWHMYIPTEGKLVHDVDIFATANECPQWDCEQVKLTDIGKACSCTFDKQIAPNAWMNNHIGLYWYFEPNLWQWICRDRYEFLSSDGHYANSDALNQTLAATIKTSWIDAKRGTNISFKFEFPDNEYHTIQCLDRNPIEISIIPSILSSTTFLMCSTILVAIVMWQIIKRFNRRVEMYQNDTQQLLINNRQNRVSELELLNIRQIRDRLINRLTQCEQELILKEVVELLHDYHHILQRLHINVCDDHDDLDEMLDCEMKTCEMFRRNYRDRSKVTEYRSSGTDVILQQIVDKIHCFLYHSSDVIPIQNPQAQNRVNQKYNQLYDNVHVHAKFMFGREFNYVESKHDQHDDRKYDEYDDVIEISAKYTSLKEELISNQISQISNEQFTNELSKAKIHYRSYFRKKYYPLITVQHLLALMIYCNFDELQNKFSKTY